ncbi:MAG: hypothetical protein K0S24_549 [Sphingobacterium sp.]|nr:hypothetical protein [Sphingobacterium sp.]
MPLAVCLFLVHKDSMHTIMKYLILAFYSCWTFFLQAQTKKESPFSLNGSEKEIIGRIQFASTRDSLEQNHFVNDYMLTPKSDLFFGVSLQKTLTAYQKDIAPDLSLEALFRQGNFQFTLFVDGKEIYRSNLAPGAPMQDFQNSKLVLKRPLIDNRQGQGSWSESFWNRFVTNGGAEALTDGKHKIRLEIRPYVQRDSIIVGEVIASGDLPIDVSLNPVVIADQYMLRKPTQYHDVKPANGKFDRQLLKQLKGMIELGVFKKINGLVVLKHGDLLIEEYFNGESRDSLHDPRSVGKTFASTLLGMAIADGYIRDEYQTLDKYYDLTKYNNPDPGKNGTTLYDLLTMSAGFDGDDSDPNSPGNEENMYPMSNWVDFALNLPFKKNLKGSWHYFTAGVVVLGDVLNQKVNGGLESYAQKNLFAPLGIVNYRWQYTPQGVPNTAGGIRMNALDFAKFGQLYKNEGVWQGKQILSKQWVQKSLSKKMTIPGRANEYYGYLFWNKSFQLGGNDYEAYYCAGNGGNYIIILKDHPYVIVITSSAYGQFYAHQQVDRIMKEYVLPALLNY